MKGKPTKVDLRCVGCEAVAKAARGTMIGAQETESGFTCVLCIDSTMTWLCPKCRDEVAVHVGALLKVLRDPNIFWGGLPNIVTKANT